MSIKGFVHAWLKRVKASRQTRHILKGYEVADADLAKSQWPGSVRDPAGFYCRCLCYFHKNLPAGLREHRYYFKSQRRGFGEDAFHVMWYCLFREFRPATMLEIGVYRGQILSYAALLARHFGFRCEVYGISPFTPAGDSVSEYEQGLNYLEDTRKNLAHFGVTDAHLLKAFSTDPEAVKLIQSREWDAIYVDGNHDYEVVTRDWEVCSRALKPGGFIVLDDSGLTTSFQHPVSGTAGHPGPSRLAQEIDRNRFPEVLQVGHNRVFVKAIPVSA